MHKNYQVIQALSRLDIYRNIFKRKVHCVIHYFNINQRGIDKIMRI